MTKRFNDIVPFCDLKIGDTVYAFSKQNCKIYKLEVSQKNKYWIHIWCKCGDGFSTHEFSLSDGKFHAGHISLLYGYDYQGEQIRETCYFTTSKEEIVHEAKSYLNKVRRMINNTIKEDI